MQKQFRANAVETFFTSAQNGTELATYPLAAEIFSNLTIMTEELKGLADHISAHIIHCTKEVLTSDEAARYLDISKSYLYKLTMRRQIPHYKPLGKLCYFNRLELEEWLQTNRVATMDEIRQKANDYCMKGGLNGRH